MLKGLNTSRYRPRIYIVSEGDDLSAAKVANLELAYGNNSVGPFYTYFFGLIL